MTPKQQRFVQDCEQLCRDAQRLTGVLGIPIIIDPEMGQDRIEFRDDDGRLLGELRGVTY